MQDYSRGLAPYDPRTGAIDGQVESETEAAERKRKEQLKVAEHRRLQIKKTRQEHADARKEALRELDDARHDFKLAKICVAATGVVAVGMGFGWVVTTLWWMTGIGHSGGPLSLIIIGLILGTVLDGLGLAASVTSAKNTHGGVREKQRKYDDALEVEARYETELLEQREIA